MFTGIIEELGSVMAVEPRGEGARIRIGAQQVLEGAHVGDSTAVDGCCLTVVELGEGWFEADVSDETLRRTTLGARQAGDRVNLERPLRFSDRLGGHIVQGHVDAVGEVLAPVPDLRVALPGALRRYLIEKGSITVDGVSLTVVEPTEDGFTVAVIPHTAEVTTLGARRPGDRVNLEVDLIAKYTERLLAFREEP
jgi:riboflavin synthase